MSKPAGAWSRRSIRVAVTGHRPNQDTPIAWAAVEDAVSDVFRVLEAIGQRQFGGKIGYVLKTALAEGADRLVTDMALRRAWRLHAFLPFSKERYGLTFANDASQRELARQIEAAQKVSFVDGQRLEGEGADAAYAEVGRALVERADVLLCIWNGAPPKGRGGTAEVAALMLERGGPVVWISAGRGDVRLVSPPHLPRAGSLRRTLHDALEAAFGSVERPPEMRVA